MGARDLLETLHGAGLDVRLIDDKIVVSPKERLTDALRDAIRARRGDLAATLAEEVARPPSEGIDKTAERGNRSVSAVARKGDAAKANANPPTTARVYRLTREQADDAHARPWDDEAMRTFALRRDAFVRRGYDTDDADDLAERLVLRDAEGDERRLCLECTHLGERGPCLAAAAGRLRGADARYEPVPTMLERCEAFGLRKGMP